MNRALLSGLSSLLFPFAAHAAATPAGGYLMRGGYQPGRHARLQLDASSRAFDRPHHAKPHRPRRPRMRQAWTSFILRPSPNWW
nr:hypothetical protein [Delftia acidovorans]